MGKTFVTTIAAPGRLFTQDRGSRGWTSSEDGPTEYLYQAEQNPGDLRTLSVTYAADYPLARRALIDHALPTLNGLLRLRSGWDGHRAAPISAVAATAALTWLDRLADDVTVPPQIFPLPNGGLQLEWLAAGDGLELELNPRGAVGLLGVDAAGNVIVEADYPDDSDAASSLALARKHLAAISTAIAAAAAL
jgi:hypothetical protein